jgi:hypothetical protein
MAKQVASATIHAVDVLLAKLPKKDPHRPVSQAKAIAQLMPKIKATMDLGYSTAEIVAIFSKGGIDISEPTLKAYIRQNREGSAVTNGAAPTVENESPASVVEPRPADTSDATHPAAGLYDPSATTM